MYNTLAVISLRRIRENVMQIKKASNAPLIAVVKDDGYAHGAVAVANAIYTQAEMFAVASVEEGVMLRLAGIDKEILVLSPLTREQEVVRLIAYRLTATVSSFASLHLIRRVAGDTSVRVHLAINSGMNRYGFRPESIPRAIRETLDLDVAGVYSHFFLPSDPAMCREQFACFIRAADQVKQAHPNAVRHIAATGGLLASSSYHLDGVRCGIAIYGYLPEGFEGALKVKGAMRVYADVAQSGTWLGGGIGYQKADKAYGSLTAIRCGYGDGLFRYGGLGVGRLCMDAFVREGRSDFGSRRLIIKDAAAYARLHGTTAYEALVRIGQGAVKYYVE